MSSPTVVLTKALVKRNLIDLSRYPLNTVSLLVLLYMAFCIVFFGLRAVGGASFIGGDTPSALVIGFLLWFLVQQSYQELTQQITNEFAQGTIEQFAMSRLGLSGTMVIEYFANVLTYIALLAVFAIPAMATTGRWLHVSPAIVPIIALIVVQVSGLALAVAGLALVFKRVAAPAQLMQFGFIGLLVAPVDDIPLLKLAPLTLGFRLLRDVMVDGASLWTLPSADLLILGATAAGYFAIGLAVFRKMDSMARDRGLLGQY